MPEMCFVYADSKVSFTKLDDGQIWSHCGAFYFLLDSFPDISISTFVGSPVI